MPSFNFNATIRTVVNSFYGSGTFKMILLSTLPGEAQKDSWDFRNDVTGEVVGVGYTSGGNAATLTVSAVDNVNNDVEVTCSAVSWPAATITAVAALIYKDTGSAATDPVVSMIDFAGTVSSTNGTFTVTPTDSIKYQN